MRARAPRAAPEAQQSRTLFVRGVGADVRANEFTDVFAGVGPVVRAFLVGEGKDGEHKGIGFVQYALESDAQAAISKLDGKMLQGSKMKVEAATKRASNEERRARKAEQVAAPEDQEAPRSTKRRRLGAEPKAELKTKLKAEPKAKLKAEPKAKLKAEPSDAAAARRESQQTVALGNVSGDLLPIVMARAEEVIAATHGEAGAEEATDKSNKGGKAGQHARGALPPARHYPADASLAERYRLDADRCPAEGRVCVVLPSIRAAQALVAALHGQSPGRGPPLWARQLSGEGMHMQRWRVIVRNLGFAAGEEELRSAVAAAGLCAWSFTVPRDAKGRSRGFAFVGFVSQGDAQRAIAALNGTKVLGRTVAVDWALSKAEYQAQSGGGKQGGEESGEEAAEEEEDEEDDDETEDAALGEVLDSDLDSGDDVDWEEAGATSAKPSQNESAMQSSVLASFLTRKEEDVDAAPLEKQPTQKKPKDALSGASLRASSVSSEAEKALQRTLQRAGGALLKAAVTGTALPDREAKRTAPDPQEALARTVFVRGLALDTAREQLFQGMQAFGRVRSARPVMDKVTGQPKGTAFVEFASVQGAEAAAETARQAREHKGQGVLVAGRRVEVNMALDAAGARDAAATGQAGARGGRGGAAPQARGQKTHLAREGTIEEGSEAWQALSPADRIKRARAEREKKTKLASPNFVVSATRLCVRNVPGDWTEVKLKEAFLRAVATRAKTAQPRIKQIKILREADAEGGRQTGPDARSKGIAFVEFEEHEHALCALRETNNNPRLFAADRRPIVEFAIDNVKALKAREAKKATQSRVLAEKRAKESAQAQTQGAAKNGESADGKAPKLTRLQRRRARQAAEKDAKKAAKAAGINGSAAGEAGRAAAPAKKAPAVTLGVAKGGVSKSASRSKPAPTPAKEQVPTPAKVERARAGALKTKKNPRRGEARDRVDALAAAYKAKLHNK